MKRIIILLLLILLVPLVTALANRPQSIDDLRLSLGQAPDFVAEYHKLDEIMTDAGYWKVKDYDGTYYHFNNGERLVIGAVEAPHTLWIFGNSGFQDPWLTDDNTAATRLQAFLRPYRISNRSAGGQVIRGQLAWLRETPVKPGDIVVFIDGATDAPNDVRGLLIQAERYTRSQGASWWHFRQAYIDPAKVAMMPGIPLNIPREGFIESSHLDQKGAIIEARQIYDWMTVY